MKYLATYPRKISRQRVLLLFTTLSFILSSGLSPSVNALTKSDAESIYRETTFYDPDSSGRCVSVGSVSSPDISGSAKERIKANKLVIWSYFIGKDFKPHQVAGIMGNFQAESAFLPDRVQGKGYDDGSPVFKPEFYNVTGYGLAQWTSKGRQENLVKFAKQNNKPESDLVLQLDYVMKEFKGGYKGAYNNLRAAKNYTEATNVVLNQYEMPAVRDLAHRSSLAKKILIEFKGSAAVDIESTSSSSNSCAESTAGEYGWELDGPNAMVSYSQNDSKWGSKPWGKGKTSFSASGCGPTSLAMVIATLTGDKKATPLTIGNEYDEYHVTGGGSDQMFPAGAKDHGLKYTFLGNDLDKAAQFLKDGGLVIGLFRPGVFTQQGHYMVIRATTSDGTGFYLNDPNKQPNRVENDTKLFTAEYLITKGSLQNLYGFKK